MPPRVVIRPHILFPVAAAASTSYLLLRPRSAFAEEPSTSNVGAVDLHNDEHYLFQQRKLRKPIYDDPNPPKSPPQAPSVPSADPSDGTPQNPEQTLPASPKEPGPTATDRLAVQIRHTRLALYGYSLEAEKSLNAFMKRAFTLERDFTQTVASLAPPADSNETVMPGLIYILVATLAGSIVTRNRGIILRTAVPIAFGTTAAYAALPVTMRNVGDLYEKYESRYPEVQRIHRQVNQETRYIWETGKAHSAMTVQRGEDLLDEAKKKMEDWVRQGK